MGGWTDTFPGLDGLEDDERRDLAASAQVVTLPPGAEPFRVGGPCESYIFVITGSVRVQMVSEGGREIVLYRVEDGQTCVLTTACLMAREDYPAEAVAETDVRAAVLPAARFRELAATSSGFRRFVFEAYGRRIADLMALISEVAFRRVDARLAERLLERADAAGTIAATHQELAVELGTAREVISRQLKEFERRGHVQLQRGLIRITDHAALRTLSEA